MKGTKLLLSIWLSTAAFCLLQIFFGPGGLTETARLREQQTRLEVRLEALRADNQALTARYEALRTSVDAVRLEARSLGWFLRGDVPVRTLQGAEFRLPSGEPDLSTVPRLPEHDQDLTWFFRLAWPLLVATFWATFTLWERLRPSTEPWRRRFLERRETLPMVLQTGLDFFRK